MVKIIIFCLANIPILMVSRPYFFHPKTYGFYRFFAFESIVLTFLLVVDFWFRDRFGPLQLVSWFLLFSSLFLAGHGFYVFLTKGKASGHWENTTKLVNRGVYRFIRHPLYASLIYLQWGLLLKNPQLLEMLLAMITTAALIATAKIEEADNMEKFGEEYRLYKAKTKMFIPSIL